MFFVLLGLSQSFCFPAPPQQEADLFRLHDALSVSVSNMSSPLLPFPKPNFFCYALLILHTILTLTFWLILTVRNETEGDWKVTVVTGGFENAGTSATVFLYVYGETRCSGPIILGSGKHQLFNTNSADIFKINLKDIGEIYKIRIGHDNSRKDPRWYLEEIRLENIATCELFCLPVDSWIAENENDGDIWKEILIATANKATLSVVVYEIHIHTGSTLGAETESNVFINLLGTIGDSGKRRLHRSQNNDVRFQRGQVDVFPLKVVSLGKLKKVLISHDGQGPGNGWFLESIIVKSEEEDSNQEVLFPCNRWLDEYQDDGKTERELLAQSNYST